MSAFDIMRIFYVALSRAENLLIIPYFRSQGNWINDEFRHLLHDQFPRISEFDVSKLPVAQLKEDEKIHDYSYTSDFIGFKKCPRQYMIFRKYEFVPSRSQSLTFGSLVHRTIEDLHQFIIAKRGEK